MKKKIKGFTLIELIVVMAIFSIILAATVQFMPIAERIMGFSDAQHEGNAAVSNISAFLENELGTVEYIDIYDSDQDAKSAAEQFAVKFYEGVLKNGSTASSPTYADGIVHVLKIDNTNRGRISRYTFNCSFVPGAVSATALFNENDLNGNPTEGLEYASALNEAYYTTSSYNVVVGAFNDPAVAAGGATYEELASNMNAKNTQFTIFGTTSRGTANPKTYTFSSIASLSMVNIIARGGGGVPTYYVIQHDATDATQKSIVSITEPTLPTAAGLAAVPGYTGGARQAGTVDQACRLFYDGTSTDHYTFVYSYGVEIDTN